MSRAHAAASAQALGLADLAAEPWIGLPESSALQRHLDAQAAALGLRLAYRVRLRTFEAIGAMVAAGAGVAVVPAAALARLGPCVRGAALSEPWAQRRLCLCWDGTRPLSPTAQALRTHLADWADRAADR